MVPATASYKGRESRGSPFRHGILGDWHEGNEYCCQSLLPVHRLFFKVPALPFSFLEEGEKAANALGSSVCGGFHTFPHRTGSFCEHRLKLNLIKGTNDSVPTGKWKNLVDRRVEALDTSCSLSL